jgi:hypothetical protein
VTRASGIVAVFQLIVVILVHDEAFYRHGVVVSYCVQCSCGTVALYGPWSVFLYLRSANIRKLTKDHKGYGSAATSSVTLYCNGLTYKYWVDFDFDCFNATFSNISVVSWRPVLVVEEAGVPRREPPTMGKQLVNFITCGCESSAPFL